MLVFNDPSGSFCAGSQRKGEKREEIVQETKVRKREERGTGMSEINRRNRNIPPLPLPATRIAGLNQL